MKKKKEKIKIVFFFKLKDHMEDRNNYNSENIRKILNFFFVKMENEIPKMYLKRKKINFKLVWRIHREDKKEFF